MFRVAFLRWPIGVQVAAAMLVALSYQAAYAQQAGDGQFMSYQGTALNGFSTANVQLEPERCRKVCSERSGCVGFDHSSGTNECRLFGAVSGARDDSSFNASTRYPVPGYREAALEREQEEPPPAFEYYPHYDAYGFDLAQGGASSLTQCEDACRGNSECKAFTFNAWNQKCFLKSGTAELRLEPRATTGLLNGMPHPGYRSANVVMEYYRGYTMSGTQLGSSRVATSRDKCENLCWERVQCIAFSFTTSQRECRLYQDADNRFPRGGVDSGAKIQPRP